MSELLIETLGPTEVWTFNGEAKRNAISRAFANEMREQLERVTTERKVRVVILTGAGDKAFCSGADLKERASMGEPEVRAFLDGLRKLLRSLELSDCVFIAALNGIAFGGGTELALACDLRVAAPHAELGLTETRLGIIPGGGGTQRLSRLIGLGAAKELILTGRRVGAQEALSLGLVNRVAPEGGLKAAALELANAVVEGAPLAIGAAKHAIDEGLALPLDEALALELRHYERVLQSEDRVEGLRAFAEKRKPKFQGR